MAKKKSATAGTRGNHKEQSIDFEESLDEVESIVSQLESGELGLSESLQKYEQGIRELKQCQSLLDKAEQKISKLSGFDADGNPVTAPTDVSSDSDITAKPKKLTVKKKSGSDESPSSAIQTDSGERSVDDSPGLF